MGIYDRHYYNDDDLEPLRVGWSSRSMVTVLIVINAAVQLLNLILGRDNQLVGFLWLKPEALSQPLDWYRFLTYGFAHSQDITHLVFNMLTLFFLGNAVEQKYGRKEFLRIYLVSLVLCGIAWAFHKTVNRETNAILLGASGAVTTIAMLFVFSFPHAVLRIWGVIPVRAWVVGVLLVGGNLIGNSQIQIDGRPQVAYDVHLFGAGFAAVYFFSKWNFGRWPKWWEKLQRYLPFGRKGIRLHRPSDDGVISSRTQKEADRILDKIHQQGQDSLTSKERRFLEEYSRTVRKRRSSHRH